MTENSIYIVIASAVCAFILSLIFTPIIIKLTKRFKISDKPGERKVHIKKTATLGGIAMMLSIVISLAIFADNLTAYLAFFIGAAIIVIAGVIDDIFDISPLVKSIAQLVAISVVVFFGDLYFIGIQNSMFSYTPSKVIGIIITYVWIYGIINAINLIDGLDGLACGISTITFTTFAVMSAINGNMFLLVFSVVCAASCLGFLPYNFYPAKIFMGDTGSMFLGFSIGVLSIIEYRSATLFSLAGVVLIIFVPVLDTISAIIRRKKNNKPIMSPDSSHLHHILMESFNSHPKSVLAIYVMSFMFATASIVYTLVSALLGIVLFFIFLAFWTVLLFKLDILNKYLGLKKDKPKENID